MEPGSYPGRYVDAAGVTWHVRIAEREPTAPVALVVDGLGGETPTWDAVAPLLAGRYTVVGPDLPTRDGASLTDIAAGLAALLRVLGRAPTVAVGEGRGAAVIIRMALDTLISPTTIVGIGGALQLPPPWRWTERREVATLRRDLVRLPMPVKLMPERDAAVVARLILGS